MANIIGVTGYKRSGKDSVARVLTEEFGYERIALADPLKEMALAIDPYVDVKPDEAEDEVYVGCWRLSTLVDDIGWEAAKNIADVRRFLQRTGSEGVRDTLGPDAWILRLRRTLTKASSLIDAHRRTVPVWRKVVVPDVRFPNEAEAIREMGGEIWRVERPGFEGDGHQSETSIKEIDADLVIPNMDSLEYLTGLVREAVSGARFRRG